MIYECLLAFMIGLSSSGHCLMMCGGIASSLSGQLADRAFWPRIGRTLLFHIGRISCYAMLGFFVGDLLRMAVGTSTTAVFYSRLFTGIMLLIIGSYAAGFGNMVRVIEGRMAFVWQKLQPLVRQFIRVEHYSDAYALGFLWGFLPCGIIYSALMWASSQIGGSSAALLMLCFGLGTIPALFASNLIIQKILSGSTKKLLGIALILFGLWTIASLFIGHGSHNHQQHNHSEAQHSHH